MDFVHKPVLFDECMDGLNIREDGIYVDGTVGGGGHSSGIVEKLGNNGLLICIDQDIEALQSARETIGRANVNGAKIIFENANFCEIGQVCERNSIKKVDGILLDIGVSSYQLDNPERGFSYNNDAPLDMRMDSRIDMTAAKIVNKYSKKDIRDIIEKFGEERWADRIAEFILRKREEKEIETTYELVDIIKAAIPAAARRDGPHPAKRTFQALRIAVNDELGVLQKVINEGVELLDSKGRFCIITFHSLEDRIVKNGFVDLVNPCKCPPVFPACACGKKPVAKHISRKPITPTPNEIEQNPRARSSKLRVLEKI